MQVDDTLLQRLEVLSSLRVEDSKKEEIEGQLAEIVDFVENLNELDVSQIEATFTTLTGGTPMEADVPNTQSEIAEGILKHAPRSEDGFFIVPKIIE